MSEVVRALIDAVEGIGGAMNYGTFRSERDGLRLKDTKEWVAFYVAADEEERTLAALGWIPVEEARAKWGTLEGPIAKFTPKDGERATHVKWIGSPSAPLPPAKPA